MLKRLTCVAIVLLALAGLAFGAEMATYVDLGVTNTSQQATLPVPKDSIYISNTGSVDAYFKLFTQCETVAAITVPSAGVASTVFRVRPSIPLSISYEQQNGSEFCTLGRGYKGFARITASGTTNVDIITK